MDLTPLSDQIADLKCAIRLNRWMLRTNSFPVEERGVLEQRMQVLEIKLGLAVAELETELTGRKGAAAA